MPIGPDERDPSVWDSFAKEFDDAPDHGLTDPDIRSAWRSLLSGVMPPVPSDILDAGCGTGSVALLLAGLGHRVTGIDFAPQMIALAEQKVSLLGVDARFEVQDANAPTFEANAFDVVISRHVLWAMPDVAATLRRWQNLIRPGGLVVLIEGVWDSGAGLRPEQIEAALPPGLVASAPRNLSANKALWGKPVSDNRYILTATRRHRDDRP